MARTMTWEQLYVWISAIPVDARSREVRLVTVAKDGGPVDVDQRFTLRDVVMRSNKLDHPVCVIEEKDWS